MHSSVNLINPAHLSSSTSKNRFNQQWLPISCLASLANPSRLQMVFPSLSGPRLTLENLLLFSFTASPKTHVEIHRMIPSLLPHFSIILLDLRGYGQSAIVPSTNGSGYSKRL